MTKVEMELVWSQYVSLEELYFLSGGNIAFAFFIIIAI